MECQDRCIDGGRSRPESRTYARMLCALLACGPWPALHAVAQNAVVPGARVQVPQHAAAAVPPDAPQSEPFLLDPTFNHGRWLADAFQSDDPSTQSHWGSRLVRLAGGDVVVAGLVAPFGGPNPPNGAWNLGLARYDASGTHVAWTASGPFQFWFGQYVIYPDTAAPRYLGVTDIKAFGGRLYVLVDYQRTPTDRDVYVAVFGEDGSFVGESPALSSGLDEYGAGLLVYGDGVLGGPPTKVVVVGTTVQADRLSPTFARLTEQADGSLLHDTLGGSGYVYLQAPASYCQAPPCSATAQSVAATRNPFLPGNAPQAIYIGGGVQYAGDDWDFLAVAVDRDGVPRAAFNGTGFANSPFDVGASDHRDVAYAIGARRVGATPDGGPGTDEVFLAGEVRLEFGGSVYGVGVVKRGEDGGYAAAFGNGGKLLFGACTTNGVPCLLEKPSDVIVAMALEGDRVALAGWTTSNGFCVPPCTPPRLIDPRFVALDAGSGDRFERTLPLADGGGRIGDAQALDVAASGGSFTLAGTSYGPAQFVVARVASDRLFADGFERH